MSKDHNEIPGRSPARSSGEWSRRGFLKSIAAMGLSVPVFGILSSRARADEPVGTVARPLKLAWNANSACLAAVALAYHEGILEKHGLTSELVNFSGSTDQLLEAIATGKADAGVGMALRWLKPLEQGFDVKITTGLHGGCLRLFVAKSSGISDIKQLKGKTIATGDLAGPDKNFFSVVLSKAGIDPARDVEWRHYPANLLGLAIEKGEAQALTAYDPLAWGYRKDANLVELGTNLSGPYHDRTCCLLGVRGALLRADPEPAKKLEAALLEAWHITASSPDRAAAAFVQYAPKFEASEIAGMLQSHDHHGQVRGDALRAQIEAYVEELKIAEVFKPSTDSAKFAKRVTFDVA
ncbi:MAG: ABC transporter substrate-binding protein [Rhodospirillaceae bacterium]|nr:ABC transporter substrate-binding protein [Rhodospirillaceae bacterium]